MTISISIRDKGSQWFQFFEHKGLTDAIPDKSLHPEGPSLPVVPGVVQPGEGQFLAGAVHILGGSVEVVIDDKRPIGYTADHSHHALEFHVPVNGLASDFGEQFERDAVGAGVVLGLAVERDDRLDHGPVRLHVLDIQLLVVVKLREYPQLVRLQALGELGLQGFYFSFDLRLEAFDVVVDHHVVALSHLHLVQEELVLLFAGSGPEELGHLALAALDDQRQLGDGFVNRQ